MTNRLSALNELLSLFDVLWQPSNRSVGIPHIATMDSLSKGSLEELLLLSGELADWVDLLDTIGTKLDVGSEPLDTLGGVQRGLDEGWLDDTRLAVESSDEGVGESGTGWKESAHFRMDKMPTHRNPWRGWRIRYRPWPGRPLQDISI